MADPVEPWALKQARKLREQCFLTISLATKVGKDGDLKTACDLAEHAIYEAFLSAVMRERESKWIKIDDTARDGQRYMLGWNDRTIQSWAAPGRYIWDKWLDDNAREVAPPTHYQLLTAPPMLDSILGDEER